MVKERRGAAIFAALALIMSGISAAERIAVGEESIQRIDELYERALRENYHAEGLALMRESLDLCTLGLQGNPVEYELLWRSARSAVELGETAKIVLMPDWKRLCGAMARKGIEWTKAAKRAAPDRVEGYFWQLQAIGILFDAEGVGGVIGMGVIGESRQNLDAAYRIDRAYLDYSPVIAKALYYYTLPPFLGQDMRKALAYYWEFASLSNGLFESYRQCTDIAEMLMGTNTEENRGCARKLLQAALADPTPRPFYDQKARTLLVKLDARHEE